MNFRTTRFQYLAIVMAACRPKLDRGRTERAKRTPKALSAWHWRRSADMTGGKVFAQTRSEARARVKSQLGIKRGRMPMDVELSKAA